MDRPIFLPYAKQSISSADIEAVGQALASEIITRGPRVEHFEKTIADYCHAHYAVAFNSASTALAAACFAAEMTPYDRLISSPNTFVASVTAGMHRGATPVFVDIDRSTGNLDIEHTGFTLSQPLSRGKNVIMPVHFAGIPVDVEALASKICNADDVIIEDAAHAIGSTYTDGQRVGCCAWSSMTVFSFHPAKTITTSEGGMVTTNDEVMAHRLRLYRNNCIERDPAYITQPPAYDGHYEAVGISGNYNFTEAQAALGLSQFQRLDAFVAKRRQLIEHYRKLLANVPHVKLFTDQFDANTAFHLCVAQIDFAKYRTSRAEVIRTLKDRDIGTQVHYIPVYRHPFFVQMHGDISGYFPEMEAYYSQALSLPLYYDLRIEDVERVVDELKHVLGLKAN